MAWNTDLVLLTRVIISDITVPQKYNDEYIQRTLVAAGILIQNEVALAYDYIFDISNITISPDPVLSSDGVAQALLPLKSACILTQGEFKKALGQGIKVRDGDSQIDTSVSFRGYRDILQLGPCASYEKLKRQINSGSASVVGAIISPYRGPNDDTPHTIEWFFDQFNPRRNMR